MLTLGQRLQAARKSRKITQVELAHLVHVKSGAVISNWEKDVNMPNPIQIKRVAEALEVGVDYLLNCYIGSAEQLTPNDQELLHKYRSLAPASKELVDKVLDHEFIRDKEDPNAPMIGTTRHITFIHLPVSAGTGIDLDGDAEAVPIEIPLDSLSEKADFVLRVSGNSMEPKFRNGDLILVQSTPTVQKGELGIFGLNGDGYFKQLGSGELISLNRTYEPIRITESDDLMCFGRVLGKTAEASLAPGA